MGPGTWDAEDRAPGPVREAAVKWLKGPVKEHAVPPCLVLVIDDNLYGLMVALSYI